MTTWKIAGIFCAASVSVLLADTGLGKVNKKGIDLDLRSNGRAAADEMVATGGIVTLDEVSPVPGESVVPQIQLRGGNVQANDGGLDNIQVFTGFRPYVKFTQSETTVAAYGKNIVATYNTSANQPLVQVSPTSLAFVRRFFSGFSTSNDGGETWTSGFIPPVPGSIFTFGDGVVAAGRHGDFYFSGLGTDALGGFTIQVNKSNDGGRTWSDAVVVQQDNGGDKEWIAVGPDPGTKNRDNLYVTWTSFQSTGAQLRFGRSTDGGATWVTKTLLAPPTNPNPAMPTNALQFSAPYVDPITGRLYVPFLHFSNADADFIRVLVSDDAGETFSFLNFNVPGAPIASGVPAVQPGELCDCGGGPTGGGFRLIIHAGANIGGGRFGLRRFVRSARMVMQPAFAARNGMLYLAWPNSTSPVFGDPAGQSNILFMRSEDGGVTWSAPMQANPSVATDIHHVLPALAIDTDPNDVHIAYYTQHSDGTIDVDLANSHDRGQSFPADRTVRLSSTASALAPTNIPLTGFNTTNYDRTVRPCYNLGEYLGLTAANGSVYAVWGDGRNSVTEPVNSLDPISGQTHPQQDVFFQKVKAQ
ncbi:MAG: exo-alpha-sialidase [Acidobacteria bacterium]|nr:exo-alpha-sialidase [Acidobacteriota bacterium]